MRSLNEVEHTALKAARGIALPWGVADEIGRAARALAAHQLPFLGPLVNELRSRDGRDFHTASPLAIAGRWHSANSSISPFCAGPLLADCIAMDPIPCEGLDRLTNGLLLLGSISVALTGRQKQIRLVSGREQMQVHATAIGLSKGLLQALSTADTHSFDLVVCGTQNQVGDRHFDWYTPLCGGVDTDEDLWRALEHFARRTYVPATHASRIAGAGAGLLDND